MRGPKARGVESKAEIRDSRGHPLLVLAASLEGVSRIHNADPIRRAHPNFVDNLRTLGADINWEETEEEEQPARAAEVADHEDV